jgi:hypothetical protein
MQPDPARIAETREWLAKAAVEKTLKAFLAEKTHSLEEIGAACEVIDADLRSVIDPAVPLTEFAWAFRYPGDHPTPTIEEARQGLSTAVLTVAGVVARLPSEAVPPALLDLIR